MIWILSILIYTGLSVWFFLSIFPYPHRKGKWYDYPLTIPVIIVAFIFNILYYKILLKIFPSWIRE